MSATALYGFLAHGIVFGAFVMLLPLGDRRQMLALAAIPVALATGIASFMHGVVGTPSLTLLALAVWQLTSPRQSRPLAYRPALALLTFAIPFYAMALGLGPLDPYTAGYQPLPLLAASFPLAALLWWRRLDVWLMILAIDLAGYASGLFANLWDVLFDPLLVIVALAVVVDRSFRHRTSPEGKPGNA